MTEVEIPVNNNVTLQGIINTHSGDLGIIVTHPHPKFGGNLRNNVTGAVFNALKAHPSCHSIIAFNFRGIGKSTGYSTWRGYDEQEDIKAVANYLMNIYPTEKNIPPPRGIIIVGYSFGAAVGCGQAQVIDACIGTVAISYPIGFWSWFLLGGHYNLFKVCTKPKLLILGSLDQFASESGWRKYLDTLPDPKEIVFLKDRDHFWFGYEKEVAEAITIWLTNNF